jgi:hypothetical protein
VKFWLNARIATITNGTPCPAGIAIVRSVKILKQPSGLTGNIINCCRFVFHGDLYIAVPIQVAYLSSPETGLFDFFRMGFQHHQGLWIISEKLGTHKWQ